MKRNSYVNDRVLKTDNKEINSNKIKQDIQNIHKFLTLALKQYYNSEKQKYLPNFIKEDESFPKQKMKMIKIMIS